MREDAVRELLRSCKAPFALVEQMIERGAPEAHLHGGQWFYVRTIATAQ